MERLTGAGDPEAFLRGLEKGPRPLLLLDYDGTLAPFRADRDEAVPYPGVRRRIRRILEAGRTRLVVISGRAVADLLPLLDLDPPPEIWGSHGWERLRPGTGVERRRVVGHARAALEKAEEVARREAPGRAVETKPVSVAVHVRGMDEREGEGLLERVGDAWRRLAGGAGLEVHPFDGGLEIRVSGRDKGSAVREVLAEEPEDAPAAYLGDDLTDEDAFRVLEGRGLRVLVRREPRETEADLRLEPPDELMDFLDAWHEHTEKRGT